MTWSVGLMGAISSKVIPSIKLTFISVAKVFSTFFHRRRRSFYTRKKFERKALFLLSFISRFFVHIRDASCVITYVISELLLPSPVTTRGNRRIIKSRNVSRHISSFPRILSHSKLEFLCREKECSLMKTLK